MFYGCMNSGQSSQSTTPIHEPRDGRSGSGRFFVATPDLLSSDTDMTSPENYVPSSTPVRNSGENGSVLQRSMATRQPLDDERFAETNHQTSSSDVVSYQLPAPVSQHYPLPSQSKAARSGVTADYQEMTLDKDSSRPPAMDTRGPPGFRFRTNDPPADHQRDSSPINRLAGLFKNLAKF